MLVLCIIIISSVENRIESLDISCRRSGYIYRIETLDMSYRKFRYIVSNGSMYRIERFDISYRKVPYIVSKGSIYRVEGLDMYRIERCDISYQKVRYIAISIGRYVVSKGSIYRIERFGVSYRKDGRIVSEGSIYRDVEISTHRIERFDILKDRAFVTSYRNIYILTFRYFDVTHRNRCAYRNIELSIYRLALRFALTPLAPYFLWWVLTLNDILNVSTIEFVHISVYFFVYRYPSLCRAVE